MPIECKGRHRQRSPRAGNRCAGIGRSRLSRCCGCDHGRQMPGVGDFRMLPNRRTDRHDHGSRSNGAAGNQDRQPETPRGFRRWLVGTKAFRAPGNGASGGSLRPPPATRFRFRNSLQLSEFTVETEGLIGCLQFAPLLFPVAHDFGSNGPSFFRSLAQRWL